MPDNWDDIITAASSGFGLVALGLLVIGTLAVPMTKGATPNMRIGVFMFLVVSLMTSVGFAITQIPEDPEFAPGHEVDEGETASQEVLDHMRALNVDIINDNTFVLDNGGQTYIQALGTGDDYHMEYREGSADKHFQCGVNGRELMAAFTSFKAGSEAWRTICAWEKLVL